MKLKDASWPGGDSVKISPNGKVAPFSEKRKENKDASCQTCHISMSRMYAKCDDWQKLIWCMYVP